MPLKIFCYILFSSFCLFFPLFHLILCLSFLTTKGSSFCFFLSNYLSLNYLGLLSHPPLSHFLTLSNFSFAPIVSFVGFCVTQFSIESETRPQQQKKLGFKSFSTEMSSSRSQSEKIGRKLSFLGGKKSLVMIKTIKAKSF